MPIFQLKAFHYWKIPPKKHSHLLTRFKVWVCEGANSLQELLHMTPAAIPVTNIATFNCHASEKTKWKIPKYTLRRMQQPPEFKTIVLAIATLNNPN